MQEFNLDDMYKDIVDNESNPIMFVDMNHIIRYMNKSALLRYAHRGGENLIGKSLLDCHNENSGRIIKASVKKMQEENIRIGYEYYNKKHNEDLSILAVRDKNGKMIGYYEKHEPSKK